MLNIAISLTFKLIFIIMLLYILAYIVDLIYIDINVDDDLGKAVDDIIKKNKGDER